MSPTLSVIAPIPHLWFFSCGRRRRYEREKSVSECCHRFLLLSCESLCAIALTSAPLIFFSSVCCHGKTEQRTLCSLMALQSYNVSLAITFLSMQLKGHLTKLVCVNYPHYSVFSSCCNSTRFIMAPWLPCICNCVTSAIRCVFIVSSYVCHSVPIATFFS